MKQWESQRGWGLLEDVGDVELHLHILLNISV